MVVVGLGFTACEAPASVWDVVPAPVVAPVFAWAPPSPASDTSAAPVVVVVGAATALLEPVSPELAAVVAI